MSRFFSLELCVSTPEKLSVLGCGGVKGIAQKWDITNLRSINSGQTELKPGTLILLMIYSYKIDFALSLRLYCTSRYITTRSLNQNLINIIFKA